MGWNHQPEAILKVSVFGSSTIFDGKWQFEKTRLWGLSTGQGEMLIFEFILHSGKLT